MELGRNLHLGGSFLGKYYQNGKRVREATLNPAIKFRQNQLDLQI